MTENRPPSGLPRRHLLPAIAWLAALPAMARAQAPAGAPDTPLPSTPPAVMERRAGEAGDPRLSCARPPTRPSAFVPPEERIATFDQDGTLWVEHPIYTQVVYCLDRVPAVVKAEARILRTSSRSRRSCPATARRSRKLTLRDLRDDRASRRSPAWTVDVFAAEVKDGSATAKDPRWKRPYTELIYQPMQEVMQLSSAPTATRPTSSPAAARISCASIPQRVYGIPPEQVVGTRGRHQIRLRQGRQAVPDQGAEAAAQRR